MSDGGYGILSKLATGGMATVFIGRRLGAAGFTRLVAIKRAHPHLAAQPSFRRMFVAEALLASGIHHANVVAVLDVVELADELSLIMEYVDGCSASQLTSSLKKRGERLDPALALRIVAEATEGLAAAHELSDPQGRPAGVVHRDVSPQNILIGSDGIAKIADFGIAKVLQSGQISTGASVLRGKLGYMSPEYVTEHRTDLRGDIFGMGVVLWELLTGRRLFVAETEVETLKRVAASEAPAPSSLRADLPAELDRVVAKALARDPRDRYQTASDLLEDLHAVSQSAGLVARSRAVAELVREHFGEALAARRALLAPSSPETSGMPAERTASIPGTSPDETSDEASAASEVEPTTVLLAQPPSVEPEATTVNERALPEEQTGGGRTEAAFTQLNASSTAPRRAWRAAALVLALAGVAGTALVVFSSRGSGSATPEPATDALAATATTTTTPAAPMRSGARTTAPASLPEPTVTATSEAPQPTPRPAAMSATPPARAKPTATAALTTATPIVTAAPRPTEATPAPKHPARCQGLDGLPLAACLENEARKKAAP